MIEFYFEQSNERVVAYLAAKGKGVVEALRKEMAKQMIVMSDRVRADKLSGQVLKNRTGTLRRSINAKTEFDEAGILGTVGVDPTAPYGKIHEYGGTVTVRAHLRRSKLGAKPRAGRRVAQGPQNAAHGGIGTWVREHQATYPQRSFLRTTLREMGGDIVSHLQQAAATAAVSK